MLHETDHGTRVSPHPLRDQAASTLLSELVAHLREHRTDLRQEWAQRITKARLLTAMSEEEVFSEATAVYDQYVRRLVKRRGFVEEKAKGK